MTKLTEVTPVSISYLVLGGFVVLFSMVSMPMKERLYIGEVVLGTAFGIIIGPHCADIFDPRSWGSSPEVRDRITLEVMRVVLATGLFAIGVELPKTYLKEHARSLLVMVVPTMAFGWLVVAGLIQALFPAFTFISALTISACLTPTDPVLAATIIGGKFATRHVPVHIRRLLSAESAANDGLAYPFLSISIYLATESSKRTAFGKWLLIGWLYQVILGTLLGAILGLAFSHLMRFAHRKGLIDRESFVAQYLALAIFTIGIVNSLGSDDLLAAFAAGSAVSWDGHFNARTEDEVFSSVIDLVLNCTCFVYIGAWLPFESWNDTYIGVTPWRLVVLFLAILALRRIPSILLLYKFVPDIHNWREALFCGHFGPMGVGAIFISTLAVMELPRAENLPRNQNELLSASLHPIVSFAVLGSIIIHGLSISTFCFGRRTISRTVTLSSTFSRTLTSRQATSSPDWLLSARRGTRSEVSGSEGLTNFSQDVREIQRAETPKGKEKSADFTTSARSSIRQQASRNASVAFLPEADTGPASDGDAMGGQEGKRGEMRDVSGHEPAGILYASLHDARENAENDERSELDAADRAEAATEENTPRTVRFKSDIKAEDAEKDETGATLTGTNQVQFLE